MLKAWRTVPTVS